MQLSELSSHTDPGACLACAIGKAISGSEYLYLCRGDNGHYRVMQDRDGVLWKYLDSSAILGVRPSEETDPAVSCEIKIHRDFFK